VARRMADPRLVDSRNRVALSREAREALGVGPDDYVQWVVDGPLAVRLVRLKVGPVMPGGLHERPFCLAPKNGDHRRCGIRATCANLEEDN